MIGAHGPRPRSTAARDRNEPTRAAPHGGGRPRGRGGRTTARRPARGDAVPGPPPPARPRPAAPPGRGTFNGDRTRDDPRTVKDL